MSIVNLLALSKEELILVVEQKEAQIARLIEKQKQKRKAERGYAIVNRENLKRIIFHLWDDERKDYEADPTPGHIFEALKQLSEEMKGGQDEHTDR